MTIATPRFWIHVQGRPKENIRHSAWVWFGWSLYPHHVSVLCYRIKDKLVNMTFGILCVHVINQCTCTVHVLHLCYIHCTYTLDVLHVAVYMYTNITFYQSAHYHMIVYWFH